jgi:hypothetical protein
MATRRSGLFWTVLAAIFGLATTLLRYALEQVLGDFVTDRITGVLGAWTGVEEAQVIAFVATWLLPAAIIAAAMWLTAVVLRWHRADGTEQEAPPRPPLRREPSFANSRPDAAGPTGPGRLEFAFGEGHPFSEHPPNPAGTEQRSVRVALRNAGGADLDDCNVYLERITPGHDRPAAPFSRVRLNLDAFSLRSGGQKLIGIAAYNERYPDGTAAPEIVISTPGAFFAEVFKVPADKTHTLLLRATAEHGVFAEATCRLFVEDGRLRLVKR